MDRQTSTRLGIGLVAGITALLIAALFVVLIAARSPAPPPLSGSVSPRTVPALAAQSVALVQSEKQAQIAPLAPVDPKLRPGYNFALAAHGGKATGGARPDQLIDGNVTQYDGSTGFAFTQWRATPGQSFVVELAEASEIDCVRFLLWDLEASRFYRFKLEIAPTPQKWTMITDRSGADQQCRGWQEIHFEKQKVKFIRLTGTFNSVNSGFHVVELQACIAPPGGFPPDQSVFPPDPNAQKVDLEF